MQTNGLENFWSLLKRSIEGSYVSVDPVHLFRYVDEQTYRFNERKKNDLQRFVGALKDVIGKRLTYKELISADMLPRYDVKRNHGRSSSVGGNARSAQADGSSNSRRTRT